MLEREFDEVDDEEMMVMLHKSIVAGCRVGRVTWRFVTQDDSVTQRP